MINAPVLGYPNIFALDASHFEKLHPWSIVWVGEQHELLAETSAQIIGATRVQNGASSHLDLSFRAPIPKPKDHAQP